MLRLGIFVVVVTAVLGKGQDHDYDWINFQTIYNKEYTTEEEEQIRHQIFHDNLQYIQQHNSESHSFTLGINEYADMTSEEFVQVLNGYIMREKPLLVDTLEAPESIENLPKEVDWRTKGYVTGVKNQGQCGSCWAFSATGSLEGQTFKKTGKLISLSEQNLVDCSGPEGNEGCRGGLMDRAFEYIKKNKGIDFEMSYPYKAHDEKCQFQRKNVAATDVGFMDVDRGNETALQKAVADVGPVSVAIDASHPSFHFYKRGVYVEPECSTTKLDHGVLAVGYGTHKEQDYWLVKNSWGKSWGDKGYIMMARNRKNMCGIATMASFPLV